MYDEAYLTELHIEYCTRQASKEWTIILNGKRVRDHFTNGMMWSYYSEILRYWSIMYGTHGC